MELTKVKGLLDRYELFLLAAKNVDSSIFVHSEDVSAVKELYNLAAHLIQNLENNYNSNNFWELISKNINDMNSNSEFIKYINSNFVFAKKYRNSERSSKYLIARLLEYIYISEYQNKKFDKILFKDFENDNLIKTFLSYSYLDKGLSYALFLYFKINNGYLFVDWMHNSKIANGNKAKSIINDELKSSQQFLFLRTPSSDFCVQGNHNIRQWCSWEIGNYYTKNKNKKFYINFYNSISENPLLDTFNKMNYVKNGMIF